MILETCVSYIIKDDLSNMQACIDCFLLFDTAGNTGAWRNISIKMTRGDNLAVHAVRHKRFWC